MKPSFVGEEGDGCAEEEEGEKDEKEEVDGVWSWVVALGSFLTVGVTYGSMFSMVVLASSFSESLDTTAKAMVFYLSLPYAVDGVFGIVTAWIYVKYGFGVVGIVGAVLQSVGLVLCALSVTAPAFVVSLVVFVGFGAAFVGTPALSIFVVAFDKRLGAASAFVFTGSSIGMVAYPLALLELQKRFHGAWRPVLFVVSAVNLLLLLVATLLIVAALPSERRVCFFVGPEADDDDVTKTTTTGKTLLLLRRTSFRRSDLEARMTLIVEDVERRSSLIALRGSSIVTVPPDLAFRPTFIDSNVFQKNRVILLMVHCLVSFSSSLPILYIVDFAVTQGYPRRFGSFAFIVATFGGMVARLGTLLFVDAASSNDAAARWIYFGILTMSGVVLGLWPVMTSRFLLLLFAALANVLDTTRHPFTQIIMKSIVPDEDHLAPALGSLWFAEGFTQVLGAAWVSWTATGPFSSVKKPYLLASAVAALVVLIAATLLLYEAKVLSGRRR